MRDKTRGILISLLIMIMLVPTMASAQGSLMDAYGIVNTSYLNLRYGDGIKFESLDVLSGGTRLEILGRNIDSSWYLVSDGERSGWVHSRYVALRGKSAQGYPVVARASLAKLTPNVAIVNTSYLNLREGAGVKYSILRILPGATSGKLIGRNADWSWVYVELEDGTVGWLSAAYVVLRGETVNATLELLENGMITSANHGVVNTSYLNMRSGDGIEYKILEILPGGSILEVLGRSSDNAWIYVRRDGREGWVHSGYVVMRGQSMHAYPLMVAAQDAPMAETIAIVNTPFLNLRSGDSYFTEAIDQLAGGAELRVLGRSERGSWYLVETTEGQVGWVSAAYVVVRGPVPSVITLG